MNMTKRIVLSLTIVVAHVFLFFLPLTEIFLIYIILFNPRWFREFLNNLDRPPDAALKSPREGVEEAQR